MSSPAELSFLCCCGLLFSFEKAVLFDGNSADSGAAYAATGGSLTFQKPSVVRFRNGITYDDQYSVSAAKELTV